MKKKALIAIPIIIILALAGYFTYAQLTKETGPTAEGRVIEVDLEQMAFDGPALITVRTNTAEVRTIAVPSMGIQLCEAFENITAVHRIEVDDQIEVKGEVTEEGTIVPCESSSHYLRVTDTVQDETGGIAFTYVKGPNGYILEENTTDALYSAQLMYLEDYQALQDNTEPREGPPTINISVYTNSQELTPTAWAQENPSLSNIALATEEPYQASLGEGEAITYTADGLYPIETYILTHEDKVYVFQGSYLTREDAIYTDYHELLESVVLY